MSGLMKELFGQLNLTIIVTPLMPLRNPLKIINLNPKIRGIYNASLNLLATLIQRASWDKLLNVLTRTQVIDAITKS